MFRRVCLLLILFLIANKGFSLEPEIVKFKNGLTLIFEERKGSDVCAIQIWVKVGSKYEDERNSGITHFIEHLIFKGSKNLPPGELSRRIEAEGGSLNAYTSYDNTVYHVVLPKKAWREGFLLLSEAILNANFPDSELEKERRVVLEEIKMNEDDPWRKLYQELFKLSYMDHPYGKPIIGSSEIIKKISREEIVQYYKSHYVPERMVIVCVGDIDKDEIIKLIDETFGGLSSDKGFPCIKGSADRGKGIKVIEREIKETYIAISYPIPSILSDDIPALYLLSSLLTEGESSRLQSELKNRRGVVNGISSYVFSPKEDGVIIFSMNFLGRDYERVLKEFKEEIRRVKEGIQPWELKKAKNQIMAQTVYSMETSQGRARILGHYYSLTDDPKFIEKFLTRIREMDEKDVLRVIEKYLNEERECVVVLLPKEDEKRNPLKAELDNGLKILINRKTDTPSFSIVIGFKGGPKDEPSGKSGLISLLSRMLLKGTKKMTSHEISKFVDILGGELESFSGYNLFGLRGMFLSKDFDEVIKFLKEIITENRIAEEELPIVKKQILAELRMKEDEPSSFTFKKFYEHVFAGHPYGRDVLGREEDIERISSEDLKRAYELFVSPRNCIISISGDIEISNAISLIKEVFSSWEGRERYLKKDEVPFRKGYSFFQKEIYQNHMIYGFKGVSLNSEDRFAVEIIDAILSGMGGRIFRALREERPFAYATTFFNIMGFDFGLLGLYLAYDHKNSTQVRKVIEDEINKIVEFGFSDEEVERAKKYLIGTFLINMQSNSSIAYRMLVDMAFRGEPDFFRRWPKEIERIKRDEVNLAAKRYLRLDDAAIVVVGKETKD